ncbi:hypothetical protein R3P38DRAFT_3210164 [Favolaschia claudopus]|uniref:Uncharacterized protein n=1 Tax=Favolaschia claudopus TaxID=2862362 RepID=A0AAW0AHV6_9AGAR
MANGLVKKVRVDSHALLFTFFPPPHSLRFRVLILVLVFNITFLSFLLILTLQISSVTIPPCSLTPARPQPLPLALPPPTHNPNFTSAFASTSSAPFPLSSPHLFSHHIHAIDPIWLLCIGTMHGTYACNSGLPPCLSNLHLPLRNNRREAHGLRRRRYRRHLRKLLAFSTHSASNCPLFFEDLFDNTTAQLFGSSSVVYVYGDYIKMEARRTDGRLRDAFASLPAPTHLSTPALYQRPHADLQMPPARSTSPTSPPHPWPYVYNHRTLSVLNVSLLHAHLGDDSTPIAHHLDEHARCVGVVPPPTPGYLGF